MLFFEKGFATSTTQSSTAQRVVRDFQIEEVTMYGIDISADKYFQLARFSLRFLGCWPEGKMSLLRVFRIFVNLSILFGVTLGEFVFAISKAKESAILSLDALCPCVTRIVTLVKLFLVILYRKQFMDLFDEATELIRKEKYDGKEKIVNTANKIAHLYVLLVFLFGNFTNLFYFLRPILKTIYFYITGESIIRELPFRIFSPYDLYKSPLFEVSYLSLGYSGIVTVFGFSGIDGSFIGFCLYISALFKSIQFDLNKAFQDIKSCEQFSQGDNNKLFEQLRPIIIKHINLIKLTEKFRKLYKIIILGHFLSAALVLGISSIDLILATGFAKAIYVFYNLAVLTQLYIYCSGGTYVTESSTVIAQVAYSCEWYKCDARMQQIIMVVIMRSQKGISLTVPFFTPSLPTYGTILSTSGSYITLLKTVL